MILRDLSEWMSREKINSRRYSLNLIEQQAQFATLGLNRDSALVKLNNTMSNLFATSYSEGNGMNSEHLVIFAAISECFSVQTKRILEIGTHNGQTGAILASLFPKAEVITIDLEDESSDFKSSYDRSDSWYEFIVQRDELIQKFGNLKFIQAHSLSLTSWANESFDLIWIDGAHGYPIITADIINAYRLLSGNGIAMVDDVFLQVVKSDSMYKSAGAFETLVEMRNAKMLNQFQLFRKRLAQQYNRKHHEKFVAVFRKQSHSY